MEIAIYQINSERDRNKVLFASLEETKRYQKEEVIDSEIYDKVFEGEVDCKNLEEVFEKFNINRPKSFQGHSMSVSDIVEVKNENGNKNAFHFCDSIGFAEVKFDPTVTKSIIENLKDENKMKVVLLEPGKVAVIAEIGTTLEDMQNIVGGDIEAYYPFDEEVCFVCDEEGKLKGSALNRAVYGENKEMIEIIAGTAFVCDCSGENFGSLNEGQQKKYCEMFRYPERFFRINDEIKAVQYKPQRLREDVR